MKSTGADDRNRTGDLVLTKDALYQLSYIGPQKEWWTGEDSNLRSPQGAADLQSAAISRSATRPAY